MAKIESPHQLLVRKLASMLYVERELAETVLPELVERVGDQQLTHAFERHLVQTRGHVANLEHAFSLLDLEPETEKNAAFDGLTKEHEELAKMLDSAALEDVVHASAATHTEHFELAAYEGMINLAESLGETEIVHLLEENFDQEREALEQIRQIARQLATQHASA